MKVCYFGTFRKEYNRNKIILASMKTAGIEIIECHEKLWNSIEDRVNVTKGGWLKPKFWLRVAKTYFQLLKKFKNIGDFDVLMTGYPGQFDVFVASRLAKKRKTPLVLDVFMSLYVVSLERRLEKSKMNAVKLINFLERISYRKPTLLIHDTQPYSQWLSDHFDIPMNKIRLVPTGADETIFKPSPISTNRGGNFTVLFYGTFIPNHGLGLIASAMDLLREEDKIKFLFIGDGPEKEMLVRHVQESKLKNVEFVGWVDQEKLVEYIQRADLCLGAFGSTLQSLITVHNKVYESMACGKAMVTGKSPAIETQFVNRREILYCERTPEDIANAILEVYNNPQLKKSLEKNSRERFVCEFSLIAQGKKIEGYLNEALAIYAANSRGR